MKDESEIALPCLPAGFKRAELRDNTTGQPTGQSCLYSVAGEVMREPLSP
jgi:hypothetical protein